MSDLNLQINIASEAKKSPPESVGGRTETNASVDDTQVIDVEAVQKMTADSESKSATEEKTSVYLERNVCFIGNLSSQSVNGVLSRFGHCAYGTSGVQSHQDLADLIKVTNPDWQLMKRILVQEGQSADAELNVNAVVLAMFGYERFYAEIAKKIQVPVLLPSKALGAMLREKRHEHKPCVGVIGTRFDLDPEFWQNFAKRYEVEIIFPDVTCTNNLTKSLILWIKTHDENSSAQEPRFYEDFQATVKNLIQSSPSFDYIVTCNVELNKFLEQIQAEYPEQNFISMVDVLRTQVLSFRPSV